MRVDPDFGKSYNTILDTLLVAHFLIVLRMLTVVATDVLLHCLATFKEEVALRIALESLLSCSMGIKYEYYKSMLDLNIRR